MSSPTFTIAVTLGAAERLDERANELRAAEAAAQHADVHACTWRALARVRPEPRRERARGRPACRRPRSGPAARAASGRSVPRCPGPYSGRKSRASASASAFVVPSRARRRAPAPSRPARAARSGVDARDVRVDDRDRPFERRQHRRDGRALAARRVADRARHRPARTPPSRRGTWRGRARDRRAASSRRA